MTFSIGAPALKATAATAISPFDDSQVANPNNLIIANGMVRRYFGVGSVMVTPPGFATDSNGKIIGARPMVFSTDGLIAGTKPDGSPLPGSGLMVPNQFEYECYSTFNEQVYRRGYPMAFTHDDHTNPSEINLDYVTNFVLTPEVLEAMEYGYTEAMERYTKAINGGADPNSLDRPVNHALTARTDPEFQTLLKNCTPFTIRQLVKLFGDSVLQDGEFRPHLFNFTHCVSNIAKPIPAIQAILDEEKHRIQNLISSTGIGLQTTRLMPIGKKYVVGHTYPDELGLGGNGLFTWMRSGRVGRPLGHQYQFMNWVVIGGAVLGITVEELARYAAQCGFQVLLLLSAIEHLPGPFSKLMQLAPLRNNYPNAILAQYQWPEKLLGPAPAGYNVKAKEVLRKDIDVHVRSAFGNYGNILPTGMGDLKIIRDWDANSW